MNNAKMWLVVKPTVGVPLFLTGVAVGSFAVHVAVLTNTNWVSNFLQGRALNAPRAALPTGNTATVTFSGSDTREGTVRLTDGRTAHVVFDQSTTVASATTLAPK